MTALNSITPASATINGKCVNYRIICWLWFDLWSRYWKQYVLMLYIDMDVLVWFIDTRPEPRRFVDVTKHRRASHLVCIIRSVLPYLLTPLIDRSTSTTWCCRRVCFVYMVSSHFLLIVSQYYASVIIRGLICLRTGGRQFWSILKSICLSLQR